VEESEACWVAYQSFAGSLSLARNFTGWVGTLAANSDEDLKGPDPKHCLGSITLSVRRIHVQSGEKAGYHPGKSARAGWRSIRDGA
jgi:hypothetical protein